MLVALLSAGWVLPVWYAVDVHLEMTLGPTIGSSRAQQGAAIGAVWLYVVIADWAFRSSLPGAGATRPH